MSDRPVVLDSEWRMVVTEGEGRSGLSIRPSSLHVSRLEQEGPRASGHQGSSLRTSELSLKTRTLATRLRSICNICTLRYSGGWARFRTRTTL